MARTTVKTVSAPATIAWRRTYGDCEQPASHERVEAAQDAEPTRLPWRPRPSSRPRFVERPDEPRGPQERDDADDEHAGRPAHGEHDPADAGPEEDARALDRAGDGVRHCELLRRRGKRGRRAPPAPGGTASRTAITTVSAYTVMIGACVSTRRAIAVVRTARTRSLIAITHVVERSANAASGGDARAAATIRTSMMRPTAVAPPDRNATTASAIRYAQLPNIDAAQASCRRRSCGLVNTTAIGRRYEPRRNLPNFAGIVGRSRWCSPSGGYPYPYKEELLWERTKGSRSQAIREPDVEAQRPSAPSTRA